MAWFVVETRYVPERFADVRPRHREYLRTLVERGVVAVAGPLENDIGGLLLFQAEDRDALQELLDADPYHLEGALAERTVREFTPVMGTWVPKG